MRDQREGSSPRGGFVGFYLHNILAVDIVIIIGAAAALGWFVATNQSLLSQLVAGVILVAMLPTTGIHAKYREAWIKKFDEELEAQ